MLEGWRIVKSARKTTAFDGEGAKRHGGRWNSPGTAVVYLAGSRSLALLELLVHLQSSRTVSSYVAIRASFAEKLVEEFDPRSLPRGWRRHPAPEALQRLGDLWVAEARSAVLRVPSAIVPEESNYLVNPSHAGFARISFASPEPFQIDARLG
jgi:RES domain-containing protein